MISFSEAVLGADVATNYELRSQGPDGLLGNADDAIVPLAANYSNNTATLTFSALPQGVYRLTIKDTITDLAGDRLDGNGDGIPGGDWTQDFASGAATTILPSPNGFVFDPAIGGFGAGQLVQGTSNAFDGLNRLTVGGMDFQPAIPLTQTAEVQSLVMSGSGSETNVPSSTMWQVPGLTTTVVSAGAATPIQVQGSLYCYNGGGNFVEAYIFVDGEWNDRSFSHENLTGQYNTFSVDVADTLTLSPGTHTISVYLYAQGSIAAYPGYSYANITKLVPVATPDLLDGGRTVVTPSQTLAGLLVSREITVPNTGLYDFARTVDTFTNPTADPITTTVQIVGNLGSDAATTVFATSDGDRLVGLADQWVGTDDADGVGTPAIIHYIHGPLGLRPTSVQVVGDNIEWTYQISVDPGQTLRLASFTIVGDTRAVAVAAANALVSPSTFEGQAAAFFDPTELASIANFQFDRPPVADAAGPYIVDTGGFLALDGSRSSDLDSALGDRIISYDWDFNGDGTYEVSTASAVTEVPWSLLQSLPRNQPLDIALRVTDSFGSTSTARTTLTLEQALTTTALTPDAPSSVYGDSVTLTALVTAGASPVPIGQVTFREGSTILAGPISLDGNGYASCTLGSLPASVIPHDITADYSGTTDYTTSSGTSSLTVSARPITVSADARTKTYGDADPALTYRITSGALANGDSISGNLTRDTGEEVGSRAIRQGTLTAGGNYNLTYEEAGLTITPATLAVTADPQTKVYGQGDPALTYTLSGFVNGETSSVVSGAPTLITLATAASRVTGSPYPILVSAGSISAVNYSFVFVGGALSVTPAPLTITASNAAKMYGAALPVLTASYTGFVNGDGPTSLARRPTMTTTSSAASPVLPGGYAIIASDASDPNYAISYQPGTLLITPAPLTITANNASMFQGAAFPPLSVSYSGLVNGDSPASLNTPPTVTTPATPLSPAGNYPIVAGGASSPNYAINYGSGVLVVTPAPVRVLSVSIQKVRLGKSKKTTQVIVLQFCGALNAGGAQGIGSYSLATIPSGKKQKSKAVALSQATYNPANNTVRLVTRKPLVLNPPLRLTLNAGGLLDSLGRPLDGDHDGQPGGSFATTLRK